MLIEHFLAPFVKSCDEAVGEIHKKESKALSNRRTGVKLLEKRARLLNRRQALHIGVQTKITEG